MPNLTVAYDPEVWEPPAGSESSDGLRFRFIADGEPAIVCNVSAVALDVGTSREGAEAVFGPGATEGLDDVEFADGDLACRYLRFPRLGELLPGEQSEGVIVAEMHFVKAVQALVGGYLIIATVATPRVDELAGIGEQIEGLLTLASVS